MRYHEARSLQLLQHLREESAGDAHGGCDGAGLGQGHRGPVIDGRFVGQDVEEGTFSGTHNGVLHTPAVDFPPTGRAISLDYIHVLRYRHGRHASFNLVFDRLVMLEQLGLFPAPTTSGPLIAYGKKLS
jgi:hypothetical protein